MTDETPARGVSPACTCKHCGREFAFVLGFTPATDVCHYCGPLDVRKESERLIAEAQAKGGTE